MAANRIDGDLIVSGKVQAGDGFEPAITRSELAQDPLAVFAVLLTLFRVWDAQQTNLPGTAATDDLALIGTTFGAALSGPYISTGDFKTTTITRRARVQIPLPAEYEEGQTVTLRIKGGMTTTVADGSCTVDAEVYLLDRSGGVSGSDICATAAQSINSLTWADKDFTITPATLGPGDLLDVRITIAGVDTATGTAVIANLGAVELLCDIKG